MFGGLAFGGTAGKGTRVDRGLRRPDRGRDRRRVWHRAATAALLRSRGATAITFDRQNTDGGPHQADQVVVDLTDHDATARAVAAVGERYGRIDLLVNNAGIGAVDTVEDGDFARWRELFEVNVLGLANTTRAALPFLRRSSYGPAIVNVTSLVAIVGVRRRASYSATKGAVYALTLSMAAHLLDDGIRVNAVAPGTVDTPWVGRLLNAADRQGRGARESRAPAADRPAGYARGGGRGDRLPRLERGEFRQRGGLAGRRRDDGLRVDRA